MLNYFIIFSFLMFSHSSYAYVYQQCKWSDKSLTDRALMWNQEFLSADNISYADIKNNCNQTSYNQHSSLGVLTDIIEESHFLTGVIPPLCFLSSTAKRAANTPPSKKNASQYYHCNSIRDSDPSEGMRVQHPRTKKISYLYLRNPCISEEYLSSLVKTFNKMAYCFDLSPQEIRQLFTIIHHESQFTLNARSPTGARCAGQLTKGNIATSNVNILQDSPPVSNIYQNASSRCPSLIDKTIPSDLLCVKSEPCPHKHLQQGDYESKMFRLHKYDVTCQVTSDLPQCFFYAFLYFKQMLKEFDNSFTPHNELDYKQVPEEFINKYGAGLNPNEIIAAKQRRGRRRPSLQSGYFFTNAVSAYTEFQKHNSLSGNPMYELNVQTVPIISNMEHFKWFTLQLSYNGGDSIARVQVKSFLNFLKSQMDQANCSGRQLSSSDSKYCGYKKQLMSGQSLNMDSVKQEFTNYLKQAVNLQGEKMYSRDEIYEYPSKIQGNIEYFQTDKGASRFDLKNLAKKHDRNIDELSPEKQEQVDQTAEAIAEQCKIELP